MHQLKRNIGAVPTYPFGACVLMALCALSAPFASAAQPYHAAPTEPGKKIRILVLVDATKPLTVTLRI